MSQPTTAVLSSVPPHEGARSRGERLRALMDRLDATGEAWAAAGYPYSGPAYEAREAVYADLRAWNEDGPA